ncbi:GNAT family N-acetyltransferase [Pseudoroseicyclus tamaricis]|uniref:GNAT family N-acetyltransferase n=1 Tax=Pseudoroseicyclus tamaricis TaxID=2705421 RepID=A0A6B2K0J8_9RHOB|nr:GNAT family N-acetyltransferase [Pseudoroseicyclus tamaricis]NDV02469.1 GNAT family N-acetyltransferase [Pseudoroseicyclus tamaricis]
MPAASAPAALSIRPATGADIAGIDAMMGRAWSRQMAGAYPPSLLILAVPYISRAQPALVTSGRYYVAEEAGRILGAGGWSGGEAGRGDVRHVAVDASAAGRGIGRALMERSIAAARDAGVTRLNCTATLNAVPFYEAVGFRALGPTSVRLGPALSLPCTAMVREL